MMCQRTALLLLALHRFIHYVLMSPGPDLMQTVHGSVLTRRHAIMVGISL